MSTNSVERADVDAALERIRDHVVRTPATLSRTLSEITGATVIVKFENLQFTGSFKDRGALNRLLHSPPAPGTGVIAASAGNHAQGVAHHAARLGIHATIVMPETTPFVKVARTRRLGAECVLSGPSVIEAQAAAERIAAERDLTMIHPFDDPDIIAGQGTVALELIDEFDDLDVIVAPVGGGGLISGIGAAVAGTGIDVVGVQADRYASFEIGRTPGSALTVADGIAVKTPGRITSAMIHALGIEIIAVPETTIEAAITYYIEVEKTVAEGAGAASLAAVLHEPRRFAGKRVGVILSGGNIDPHLLATVTLRGLASQGRLWRLQVIVDDHPGALGAVSTLLASTGVNIVDVAHERWSTSGARQVALGFVIDAFDSEHAQRARDQVASAGHHVTLTAASEPG